MTMAKIKSKAELLNDIASKFNLLKYAPATISLELRQQWADEGIEAVIELRKKLEKEN